LPLLESAGTPEDPARVVNIGSMLGTVTVSWTAYSYGASKAGLHHITRVFANEFADRNITVNAIAPGPFATEMTAHVSENDASKEAIANQIPLKRWGTSEDAAGLVLFLCSRAGAYVSGAIVPLDGGATAKA
jgi:NAD(P)-dependent dehydrogenase (short-subunit alcohol dehydrogenase family)